MLRIRVLGGLDVQVGDGAVVIPPSGPARALLAWLAVHPGPQPRARLAALLRPDAPEAAALKSVRQALWGLRRLLGPEAAGAIAATREAVALDPAVAWVDLGEFQRLRAVGDHPGAIALCRGDLLADVDEEWAHPAREAHRGEVARLLADAADAAEAAGDAAGAVAWSRRAVEAEPLAESPARALMRRLAAAGDRPAALAAHAALAERLERELGMAPSEATRALAESIRREPRPDPVPADAPAPPLPPALAAGERFVGRSGALGWLEAAWGRSASGRPLLAIVAGEPGIGKTALARAFARRSHRAGAQVLLGHADEEAALPYGPWVEALGRHLEDLDEPRRLAALAAHGGALAHLVPGLGPAPARADADPAIARYLAFEAARAAVAAVGRPALMVLDDLHWADPPSLLLLRHLLRGAGGPGLMVLACVRAGEAGAGTPLGRLTADLRRSGQVATLDLDGLDARELGELIAPHAGRAGAAELAERLRARTGGNPFFALELVRHAAERGEPDGAADAVPPGVREVVGGRLERLGPGAVEALTVIALARPVADLALVEALIARPEEALDALERAERAGLVREDREAPARYAPAHALVADVLEASLSGARRARLHARIGAELERRGGPAAEVARHLAAGVAADPALAARAADWAARAGSAALAGLAYEEAARHAAAALALAPEHPLRGEWLLLAGDSEQRAGALERARPAYAAAAELARAAGDPALLARAALGAGGIGVTIAAADPALVALLEEARAALGDRAPALGARLAARLAVEVYYPDRPRAEALGREAVARARHLRDGATLAATLNARRVALWSAEHAEERLATATEMLALAEAAAEREAELQARNWRVLDLMELGRMEESEAEVDAYAAAADRLGLTHLTWWVPLWHGCFALMRGDWELAGAHGARARRIGREARSANAENMVEVQEVQIAIERGRLGEIDLAWTRARMERAPEPMAYAAFLGLLHAHVGDGAAARELLATLASDGWAALPRGVNWHVVAEAAELCALVGSRAQAESLYAILAPHAALFPTIARAAACLGSAHLYLGLLAATAGRAGVARAHLERAEEANARVGARPRAERARTALARIA